MSGQKQFSGGELKPFAGICNRDESGKISGVAAGFHHFSLALFETYAMSFTSKPSHAATAFIRPVELRDGGAFAEPRRVRRPAIRD
jgi:hypothetical protein